MPFRRDEKENPITSQLITLLNDENALRRLSGANEAEVLQVLLRHSRRLARDFARQGRADADLRRLVSGIRMVNDAIRIDLRPAALGINMIASLPGIIPRLAGRPFREVNQQMHAKPKADRNDVDLVSLLSAAMDVQRLVLHSPEPGLKQLGKREGRFRTHIARLLRISWFSPRIVEAVTAGTQPKPVTRKSLMSARTRPMGWNKNGAIRSRGLTTAKPTN